MYPGWRHCQRCGQPTLMLAAVVAAKRRRALRRRRLVPDNGGGRMPYFVLFRLARVVGRLDGRMRRTPYIVSCVHGRTAVATTAAPHTPRPVKWMRLCFQYRLNARGVAWRRRRPAARSCGCGGGGGGGVSNLSNLSNRQVSDMGRALHVLLSRRRHGRPHDAAHHGHRARRHIRAGDTAVAPPRVARAHARRRCLAHTTARCVVLSRLSTCSQSCCVIICASSRDASQQYSFHRRVP